MTDYKLDVYYCRFCRSYHQCHDESIDALRFCSICGKLMIKVGEVSMEYEDTLVPGGYF